MNRPLLLKLLSGVVVFGAWEIAGRVPVSFGFPSAPWKGAFSWWVRIPPSGCRFRLVAAGAVRGGNDMD